MPPTMQRKLRAMAFRLNANVCNYRRLRRGTFAAPKVPTSAGSVQAPALRRRLQLRPAPVLTPARPGLPSPAFECTDGAFPFTPSAAAPAPRNGRSFPVRRSVDPTQYVMVSLPNHAFRHIALRQAQGDVAGGAKSDKVSPSALLRMEELKGGRGIRSSTFFFLQPPKDEFACILTCDRTHFFDISLEINM